MFLAFHSLFLQQRVLSSNHFQRGIEKEILFFLLFVNIIFLSVRFFWVPRNLRHLLFAFKEYNLKHYSTQKTLPAFEITLNITSTLVHGALYFLICRQFEYFVFVSSSSLGYTSYVLETYILLHCSLLILNSFWLVYLTRREDTLPSVQGSTRSLGATAKIRLWYRNNLALSLLAMAPIAVFSPCQSSFSECLSAVFPDVNKPFFLFPTSPLNLAIVFDTFYEIFSPLGVKRSFAVFIWGLLILLANSLLDLFCTAHYYIDFEEVETDVTPPT